MPTLVKEAEFVDSHGCLRAVHEAVLKLLDFQGETGHFLSDFRRAISDLFIENHERQSQNIPYSENRLPLTGDNGRLARYPSMVVLQLPHGI